MADLSVDKVFQFIQFVANKQSRGWVSPSEFDIAAEVAQLSLYSEGEAVYATTKKIAANMLPFVKVLDQSADGVIRGGMTYPHPTNKRIIITVSRDDDNKEIKEATIAELPGIRSSTIIAPTDDYPFWVDRDDKLYIYPSTFTSDIFIEYLSIPVAPHWEFTSSGGRPEYSSSGSVQFGFDESLFNEIAMRVLANVGMNLNQETVTQYASSFNAQK